MELHEFWALTKHLCSTHQETASDLREMILELKEIHPNKADEWYLNLIHNRQHTSLDWDAGHDEDDLVVIVGGIKT